MRLRSHTRTEEGQHQEQPQLPGNISVATPSTLDSHSHRRHNKCSVMVAPIETAIELSRSLVRVPGSGADTSASAVTCDLSRGSGLAGTVSVNPQLPAFLTRFGSSPTNPSSPATQTEVTVDKLCSQQGAQVRKSEIRLTAAQPYSLDRKKSLVEVTSNSTSTLNPTRTMDLPNNLLANRQGRLVYMPLQQAARHASNILHVNTQAGPILFMPVVREGTKLRTVRTAQAETIVQARTNGQVNNEGGVGQQGSGLTVTTLEQLMKQQNTLSQENVSLQQELARFRQLFQSPERLVAVARQLGLKVNSD